MLRRLLAIAGTLLLTTACESDPCGRYVDYMCVCHAEEEGFDCATLQDEYANADSQDLQDACAIQLADQQDVDAEAGEACEL